MKTRNDEKNQAVKRLKKVVVYGVMVAVLSAP
jgi:hypothetical protein